MSKPIEVSASILCADFSKLAEAIKSTEDAGVDRFHIDVMDGHFVPNLTIGPIIVDAIRPYTKLPLDVHLMIENPWDYISDYIDAGADIINLHAECYGLRRNNCREYGQFPKEVDSIDEEKMRDDILRIKEAGKKAFIVFNPGTPVCFKELYSDIDGVLVMSVNPGFARQKFMPSVLTKIQEIAQEFNGDVAVDGGVNDVTALEAVKSGAHVLITASYLYGQDDPKSAVKTLKSIVNV